MIRARPSASPSPAPGIVGRAGLDTPVRDLMTAGVVMLAEDASLRQVQKAMYRHRVNAVLVTSREGDPLGWVTSRGLLRWLEHTDLGMAFARQAITEPPIMISASAPVSEALAKLSDASISHLLVTMSSDPGIEGVLSPLDLVGHLA
jgi:CBS domain-containing protein